LLFIDALASRGICSADPLYLGSHFCYIFSLLFGFQFSGEIDSIPTSEAGLYTHRDRVSTFFLHFFSAVTSRLLRSVMRAVKP